MNILLESTPDDVDAVEIYNSMLRLHCVAEIHDFHVWALSSGKNSLTAHVRCYGKKSVCLNTINLLLIEEFKIYHSTIQVEKAGNVS